MTANCRVLSFSLLCQFVFLLNWSCLGSGFSFIDPFKAAIIIIERNGTTNYSISCRTTDPNATTTLFLKNQEIPVGGRVTLHKQVFTIHGILLTDKGIYKCKARNSLRTIERIAVLIHDIQNEVIPCCPKLTPEKKVVVAGTSLNFTCVVDISKSIAKYLSFKWFKEEGGGSFVEIPDDQTHRKTASFSVLMIRNAQTTPLGGILYKCQMSYRGRKSSYHPRLIVMSGLSKPNITYLKQSAVVEDSKKMKEKCTASGYPVPKITWLQNGIECLKNDSNRCVGPNYQVMETTNEDRAFSVSYLIILSTKYPQDHGNYTCAASNSEGSDQKIMEVSVYTSL